MKKLFYFILPLLFAACAQQQESPILTIEGGQAEVLSNGGHRLEVQHKEYLCKR